MLQRKDLAKEFDLIVKQEIKNHNDSILQTNLCINSITEEVNKIKNEFYSHISKIENENKSLNAIIVTLKNQISNQGKSIESLIKRWDKENIIKLDENKHNEKNTYLFTSNIIELEKKINELNKYQQSLEKILLDFRNEFETKVEISNKKQSESLKLNIYDVENYIKNKLSKTQECFNEISTHFSKEIICVKEEINILKKSNTVTEKTFECINTRIKRLKGGE